MLRSAIVTLTLSSSWLFLGQPALADDPVVDFYETSFPGIAHSAVDSQSNVLVGMLHETQKFAPDGTLLWTRPFDIPGDHTLMRWLATDSEDNVLRGGYHEGPNGGYLAVKYDPDGNLLWSTLATTIGTGAEAIRCEVDELDNLYVFGEAFQGFTKRWLTIKFAPDGQILWHHWGLVGEPVAMDVKDGQVVLTGEPGGGDFYTTSLDYDGNERWSAQYQPASSGPFDVTIGPDGQVAVCGWGMTPTPMQSAGTVVQYDSFGNQDWAALYNSPFGGIEIFRRVAYTPSGEVVAVGYGLQSSDAWSVLKLDPAGGVLWSFLYDNVTHTGWEEARSVTVGPTGAIYVGGLSDRHASCGSIGSLEGQVLKFSAGGNLEWHAHLTCGSAPQRIHVDPSGSIAAVSFYQVMRLREEVGTQVCSPAVPNSTGSPSVILATGSTTASQGELTLTATQLPPGVTGIFIVSDSQAFVPGGGGGQGNLCLGSPIGRFRTVLQAGAGGRFSIPVDLTNLPTSPPSAVLAGQTWYFQAWHRDVNPTQTTNLTDAIAVTFQ